MSLQLRPPPQMLPKTDEPVIFGTSAQIAAATGASRIAVQAGFVVLSLAGGFGILLYLVSTLGLRGRQLEPQPPALRSDLGVLALTLGLILELVGRWPGARSELVLPSGLVAVGLVLAWKTAPSRNESSPASFASASQPIASVLLRVTAGLVLVGTGVAVYLSQQVGLNQLRDAGLALGVAFAGVALIAGPTLFHMLTANSREREQRAREHERAEMAAHLHDSVLQTLTLVQRRAEDPTAVSSLARKQERELRRWLYEQTSSRPTSSWNTELQLCLDELEDLHLIKIEVVTVGDRPFEDRPFDNRTEALLGATREAVTNAAKFSGDPTVSVFSESDQRGITVFVRDRGIGFDPTMVQPDRRGITDSILGRITRAGGSAVIRSETGIGTEIQISLPFDPTAAPRL